MRNIKLYFTCKMKKLLVIASIFFFACTQKNDAIVVQYTLSSGIEFLSSHVFDDIEVVVLHGEEAPLLGPFVNMMV